MKVTDFDYELPPERIAQFPAQRREDARLLAHRVANDETAHLTIRELPARLRAGDLLVVNDTRVLAARLAARRASGGAVELLVLGDAPLPGRFRTLARPARRLAVGEELAVEGSLARVRLVARETDSAGEPTAEWQAELVGVEPQPAREGLRDLLDPGGRLPPPPYVERDRGESATDVLDRERYQTVYAREPGAVAAPTAGLHLSRELLALLAERGIERAAVTLHVGIGTFRPVTAERLEDHDMHAETFESSEAAAEAVRRCRERGGRVVAVGTTSLRVLESCAVGDGLVRAGRGETRLFLHPGKRVRVVDALLTNFHLPRSTLLMLVAALAGRERVLRLYAEAIERGYRFFSYGDAMLLEDFERSDA